jgi:hypothetical protein
MAVFVDMSPLVDSCCTSCCRACDLGTHDYCLPCSTNPACPTSNKRRAEQRQAMVHIQPVQLCYAKGDKATNCRR